MDDLVLKRIQTAAEMIREGFSDRIDLKDINVTVYRAGTIIRIDVKNVFPTNS